MTIGASITDYTASFEPTPDRDPYRDAQALAAKVGGTLGFTEIGRMVITLPAYTAVAVAAGITHDDFPFGLVVPGTDSVLVFEFRDPETYPEYCDECIGTRWPISAHEAHCSLYGSGS